MSEEKPQATVQLGLWLTFAAFLLIIVVFKNHITEIHFGTQGVSAKMVNQQDVNNLSPEDRKNSEDELTQRVSALEDQAKANPETASQQQAQVSDTTFQQSSAPSAAGEQPALPNIAGYWMSPAGLTYQVNQYGDYVSISEISGGVVQAVATGQIASWGFTLPSYNLAGQPGMLSLQVSADQRQMAGQYRDDASGMTVPMQMSR